MQIDWIFQYIMEARSGVVFDDEKVEKVEYNNEKLAMMHHMSRTSLLTLIP